MVNIYFDEVKLVETLRFSGGQVQGYARNNEEGQQSEILASHALVVQIACHFGDPKYSVGKKPPTPIHCVTEKMKKKTASNIFRGSSSFIYM